MNFLILLLILLLLATPARTCEHGDTVPVRVANELGQTNTVQIDRCIAPLVASLQSRDNVTLCSCCGHGQGPGHIALTNFVLWIADDVRQLNQIGADARYRVKALDFGGRQVWVSQDTNRPAADLEHSKIIELDVRFEELRKRKEAR